MSKTPKFDKVMRDYFANLQLDDKGGQWRVCRFSGDKFYIRPEDVSFYKRIMVPLPTLKPKERWRRRMSYHNSYNLFKIKSSFSGKQIISAYPPETPFKIFEHQAWFSSDWNPLDCGRSWDGLTGFFSNFQNLQLAMPRPNLVTDSTNINSDYSNMSTHLKNCYLTFDTLSGENLYYFSCCDGSKDCVDCDSLWSCDTCYGSQVLYDSFRCFFCEQSRSCMDSYFLYDCRNSSNCFMSSGLRNKKYYFYNQPLSQEEYKKRIKDIDLGDFGKLKGYRREYAELKRNAIYKPDQNFRAIDCYGNWIEDSRNCYFSTYIIKCDNVNYSIGGLDYKDCYDIFAGGGGELCYELSTISTFNNYRVYFSAQIDNSMDLEYSDLCKNCHHCFGCIGLQNKSFCIFNKQYTEEEYWDLVDDIKTSMVKDGSYGEFFPPALMPFPYRISITTSYPGFGDYNNAEKYGYNLLKIASSESEKSGEVIRSSELPNHIKDVDDSILNKIVFDGENDKSFRIMKYELDFYKHYNIALPRENPLTRLKYFREIFDLAMTFYKRTCLKCGISIESAHNPEKYKNVYCEACYNTEIA